MRNSYSYLDPDLGWHLKVGEEISRSFSVPSQNFYNYTFTGNWVDHEWLANLLTFKIYNTFGYLALNVFFALIIVLAAILLNILSRKYFKNIPDWIIAFFQIFGLIACLPHFGIRIQEFSFIFFIIELWILESFINRRSGRALLCLLPLFYLWVNMHGSFLFGLGILIIFLFIKCIEKLVSLSELKKYLVEKDIFGKREFSLVLLVILGSLGVTLLTPYGLELYSFLGGYSNTYYLKAIQEWLPQYFFPFDYLQLLYLCFSSFIVVIFFYNLKNCKENKINIWHLSLYFLLFILAFKSRRNFPLMFVASFLLLSQSFFTSLELDKIKSLNLRKELKYFLLIVMFLTALSNLLSYKSFSDPFKSFCSTYPCKAVNYLKQAGQYSNSNIFNEYNWGGYLIWAYPEKKLFIDGRLPQVDYKGHTFMEEYAEFSKVGTDYKKKLAEYDIQIILIKTNNDIIKANKFEKYFFQLQEKNLVFPRYLRLYLEGSSEWEKIYSDSVASVYAKK
ncbi:MAG: hypothetical protein ACOYL8_03325 [Patescibacteria group bacterium]